MPVMRPGGVLNRLVRRSDGTSTQKAVIIIVSVASALLFGVIIFFVLRTLRVPQEKQRRQRRFTLVQRLRSILPRRRGANSPRSALEVQHASLDPEAVVNRHTSVRSVATLPAYSAVPRDGEGVIGREGDREGMDTVVEFPETAEEQEERREEEMESLWRIRQRRREEAAEREERRRRRREARARGDEAALIALREETQSRSTLRQANASTAMIADHHSRPRERRVSAVSYGDLGVARHDGSRVRANSAESDNRPLLDGAADMAGPTRPWMSRETLSTHHRLHSTSSIVSMSSVDSGERPAMTRDGSDFEVISLQQTHSRTRSRSHSQSMSLLGSMHTQPVDADVGESRIPLPEPPQYDQYDAMGFEEAPPYEQAASPSPPIPEHISSIDPPQLPTIDRLPSIRITDSSYAESPARLPSTRTTIAPTIYEGTS